MEAKHTAGPWRATLGNSQMSDPGSTIYHRGQWGVYSDADSHGNPEADARLIAAAPDMLAALRGALQLIELVVPFEGDETRNIRAAIAKATQ